MASPLERGTWGSRFGFILAASGSAVGLGNVWGFPTRVGQGGGAAFVVVYLVCAFLICAPIMMAELGLILGLWAKDIASMYTAVKAGGILVFLPVIFVLFPGLPQWIPRVVPTYYFLVPIYDLAVGGATFGTVTLELAVAIAICVALVAGRSERQLAMTV